MDDPLSLSSFLQAFVERILRFFFRLQTRRVRFVQTRQFWILTPQPTTQSWLRQFRA